MTETTETIPGPVAEPRRLERSREGRWLGGVCAGLGRYFNLSPMIYRIAFVALALAGGTGILLYVAAWLVIPDDGVEDSIAAEAIKGHRDRPWLLVGVGLLGFAAILALSSARVWPSPGNLWVAAAIAGAAIVWWHSSTRERVPSVARAPGAPVPPRVRRRSLGPVALGALIAGLGIVGLIDTATRWSVDWRVVLAVAAVALGALVAAGALTGHGVGSVVVLALAVLVAFAVSAAVRVPLFAGVGNRIETPATLAALDSRYEQGIGDLELQLGNIAFPVGETHVKATLGIGNLVVHVPNDVTVDVDARASVGEVILFGAHSHGSSPHQHAFDLGTNPARVLVLDARVGLGKVTVVRG
ncbi:MAG TPA: PspC domain-containing protein [Gaiellaceae bacterium]|jgi:phage shock protein PspC (stress-responsive transcriptional regulator)|nr:PspC domain-containing protein [Gaiellaceae bacterium]